jgi:hypothetical protein
MNTTWHQKKFDLKISIKDTAIDLKQGAANSFVFEGVPDHNQQFYYYLLKPVINGGGNSTMKDAWGRCSKFLPQPGATLTWSIPDREKLDPEHDTPEAHQKKLQALIDDITDNKLNATEITYERLVGMVDAEDADNPLTLYQVSKVYLHNNNRPLLIAVVNLINGGAPVGTLAAES